MRISYWSSDVCSSDLKSFAMWDWVGGRYSLWSAVGLPIALAIGYERFAELLDGAQEMDAHFRSAQAAANMPVILGLLGVRTEEGRVGQERVSKCRSR